MIVDRNLSRGESVKFEAKRKRFLEREQQAVVSFFVYRTRHLFLCVLRVVAVFGRNATLIFLLIIIIIIIVKARGSVERCKHPQEGSGWSPDRFGFTKSRETCLVAANVL